MDKKYTIQFLRPNTLFEFEKRPELENMYPTGTEQNVLLSKLKLPYRGQENYLKDSPKDQVGCLLNSLNTVKCQLLHLPRVTVISQEVRPAVITFLQTLDRYSDVSVICARTLLLLQVVVVMHCNNSSNNNNNPIDIVTGVVPDPKIHAHPHVKPRQIW